MTAERDRTLVIGLDGATFDLFHPMMKAGKLPRLSALLEGGTHGPLRSVLPPVTAPAWSSFMTGVEPARHGLFDFTRAEPDGGSRRVVNSRDIAARTLWDHLDEHGRTAGVYNVPVTYPPAPIQGFMWSGMLTPPEVGDQRVQPHSLYGELAKEVEEYCPYVYWRSYEHDRAELIRMITRSMERNERYTEYLMKKYDWDFFMTVVSETDWIQHALGDHLFGGGREQGEEKQEIDALLEVFYRKMDEKVGHLCDLAGPGTTVLIVSDHGFGSLNRLFCMNKWLRDQGHMAMRKDDVSAVSKLLMGIRRNPALRGLARKLVPSGVRGKVARNLPTTDDPKSFWDTPERFHEDLHRIIDWAGTRAFMEVGTQQGITINLKGRQPFGIVEPGPEYDALCETLIGQMKALKDTDGRSFVSEVHRREDVYDGPFIGEAPDIVFFLDDMATLAIPHVGRGSELFLEPFWPLLSMHRMDGILIAKGPGIREGATASARLVDIMPTALYSLGLPVPAGLDGEVCRGLFDEEHLQARPVVYGEAAAGDRPAAGGRGTLTEEEDRQLKDVLRSLGYL